MAAFLLDTNVVFELRKSTPDPQVAEWHRRHGKDEVFISSLVVGEIRQGIERLRVWDEKRAEALDGWLTGLTAAYGDRILPVSAAVAEEWGRMNASHRAPPPIDGLMAATARIHRLTLVTQNVTHVAGTGVRVVNPFDVP